MATATHTPGPWTFDRDWGRLPTIFSADGKTKIAIIEKTSRNEHTSEQAANARVIEAAPGLLAALKEAEKEIAQTITDLIGCRADNTMGVAHSRFDDVSQQELARVEAIHGRIRAALAKAEGRA